MKFGTSGLRGLVSDMTDVVVAEYARAFLSHLAASGAPTSEILIGRDLRPSSPRMAAACASAITGFGADAVDCGVLPTPALALEAARRGAAAIMVTGSHIPFDRNGLKFYRPDGEITKADEAGVVAALARPAARAKGAGSAKTIDARAAYVARADAFGGPDRLAGMRIGVYQHSAAGRDLLPETLARLGAEPVPLGRSDDFVPIDTEAVRPEDVALARAWTAEHRLDALVTTDGDGDRPLIADERGVFLRGDLVGVLTARRLEADAVATPVSSNTALERSGWFPRIARTRIGSPFVIEAMETLRGEGARRVVGYEANGGFLLGDAAHPPGGAPLSPLPTRDALTPILAVLSMAADAGAPISRLAADLPPRATASDRLEETPATLSGPLVAALSEDTPERRRFVSAVGAGAVVAVDRLDGARLTLDTDEILHVRASGNAPELRLYVEADGPDRALRLLETGLAALRDLLGARPA